MSAIFHADVAAEQTMNSRSSTKVRLKTFQQGQSYPSNKLPTHHQRHCPYRGNSKQGCCGNVRSIPPDRRFCWYHDSERRRNLGTKFDIYCRTTAGSMRSAMSAMRTCDGSDKSDANSGSRKTTIIAGTWRRLIHVFCFRTILGDRLQGRQVDNQFKELLLKSAILDQMTYLGMPGSVKDTG